MKTINLVLQKKFRNSYEKYFAGKNWGSWNIQLLPTLPCEYRMLQYENDNGQICDVIKFDSSVRLENNRFTGKTYILSKHSPNHKTAGYWFREIPITTLGRCHQCGEYFPRNENVWASTRCCIECDSDRSENISNVFGREKLEGGDNETNMKYWIHWASFNGGGNNITHDDLVNLWKLA